MRPHPYLALFTVVSTCILVLSSVGRADANPTYAFKLPDLKEGCLSSPTHPDCYDDQNVVRASGFSHFDGTGAPTLEGNNIPALLQAKPLWNRLKDAKTLMHVIDQYKHRTLLETIISPSTESEHHDQRFCVGIQSL
jgi:hypothetical protein